MVDSSFFNNIPKNSRFIDVFDEHNFFPAPDDWIIVIADIQSSTRAIATGRYKDVNMIGGAVICAVQNATGTRDWPFVFGGDGATLLIAPGVLPEVEAALVRTRSMAKNDFDLELRVGFVPICDVRERGADVLVSRYEVSPGNCLAMFGGGGVELAEELIKADSAATHYSVADYSLPHLPDLSGLSCRWESLQSQKGRILCLLVKPQAQDFQRRQSILSHFLTELTALTGEDLSQANPVCEESLCIRWPPTGLVAEAKATRANKGYWRRLAEIYSQSLIQWISDHFNVQAGHYHAKRYRKELSRNNDFCRFDDVLRMVIDCSLAEVVQIRALLDQLHAAGDIDFGLFETEQALMTCLLFDLESSQHLHFIDGDNGGFSTAATALKQQLALHEKPLAERH